MDELVREREEGEWAAHACKTPCHQPKDSLHPPPQAESDHRCRLDPGKTPWLSSSPDGFRQPPLECNKSHPRLLPQPAIFSPIFICVLELTISGMF